ncbi:MAG TPA: ABC transporter substrate-binding protein [Methanotrichaceae archaeon]|nr:ABC transporter substrate-binding protein [Methanotrichaceae archaeon]
MRRAIQAATLILLLISIGYPALAEDKVLNMGYQPSLHQIAEMVAMEKGWWAEDLKPFGITEVKEFEFPTGAPEMQAMLAGHLDVAYVGTAPPITAIAQGLDAKIVAGVNVQGSGLVFRNGLNYNGPKSLVGLSIATFPAGSIQDLVLRKWLKDNNIDVSKITIKAMTGGDAMTAIDAGKIDAGFLPSPSPEIIEDEGKGLTVVHSGSMWPNHACCSVLVSGNLIKNNPDMVKQIVKTHMKATAYINQHIDEAAEIYATRTGQDLDQVKYALKNWDGRWISDPNLQIPSAMQYVAMDYDLKYIDKELTKEDLFDTSFY